MIKHFIEGSVEKLAENFYDNFCKAGATLFDKQIIIVPNKGHSEYLKKYTTDRSGIFSGAEIVTSEGFYNLVAELIIKQMGLHELYNKNKAAVYLFNIIVRNAESILRDNNLDIDEAGLSGLSLMMADIFDQYILYRADMLDGWQNGLDDGWQSMLWRELRKEYFFSDINQIIENIDEMLAEMHKCTHVHLFNPMNIPSKYYTLIESLSEKSNVYIYLCDYGEDESLFGLLGSQTDELFQTFKKNRASYKNSLLSGIKISNCHTKMREVEVLHDDLCKYINETNCSLDEILIAAPDIEEYLPYIEGVFHCEQRPFIEINKIFDNIGNLQTLNEIFNISNERFNAQNFVDLLFNKNVQSGLGISEDEAELIKLWIEQTNIRWGFSEKSRVEEGFLAFKENSFLAGQDKILAGYALDIEGDKMFCDDLPLNNIESTNSNLFATFNNLVSKFEEIKRTTSKKITLGGWCSFIKEISEYFLNNSTEHAFNMKAVEQFSKDIPLIYQDINFSFNFFKSLYKNYEKKSSLKSSLYKGAVNISDLKNSAGLPFRAVFVLGLDDRFPEKDRKNSINIMSLNRMSGDRSALLTDRERFYRLVNESYELLSIYYTSSGDGAAGNYSSCLDALLDKNSYNISYYSAPIYGFYADNNNKLTSYDISDYPSYCTLSDENGAENISTTENGVDIEAVISFFKNPFRYYLKNNYGIYLDDNFAELLSDEPMQDIDNLNKYYLGEKYLEKFIYNQEIPEKNEIFKYTKSMGVLPPGVAGEAAINEFYKEFNEFINNMPPEYCIPLQTYAGELIINDIKVNYKCGVSEDGAVRNARFSKLNPGIILENWIKGACLKLDNFNVESVNVYSRDKSIDIPLANKTGEFLQKIINFYMTNKDKIIKFAPKSSFECAQEYANSGDKDKAIAKAYNAWMGSYNSTGECKSKEVRYLIDDIEHYIDDEFFNNSILVYSPVLGVTNE